jgi:subtilisin-like proprotein convertase family protein
LPICETEGGSKELLLGAEQSAQGDCQLRRYRMALACTGEYAIFHGGTKPLVLAAFTTTMNRVNGVYERDMSITMQLVANTDTLIFLNPATDPYTNNNGSTMLGQNVTTCNNLIGAANYDIGHVFSTGGGGIAGLGVVCGSGKARGVTGGASPVGDPFDIDYVAHEVGHQFGANHTQNNNCNRVNGIAMEPGSASTVMGYAGICSPNVQGKSDDYFHAISLQEMTVFAVTGSGNTCAQKIQTTNNPPVVQPVQNYTIPKLTPFVLTAVASDPDGDPLTYCWEQMDPQFAAMPPVATNATGPLFRSYTPSASPSRTFPRLADLIANINPTWERLPGVARNMNFRVTVRDNKPGGGCTAETNTRVSVDGVAGPFVLTSPNDPGITWITGTQAEVTWNVAGTSAPPINTADVRILLSTDGGVTYPHVLLQATVNDGSAMVTVPDLPSNTCRVRVEAIGNIYFDISDRNFRITPPPVPTYFITLSADMARNCSGDTSSITVSATALNGFDGDITLTLSGVPSGANATVIPSIIGPSGSAVIRISGITPDNAGVYPLVLTAQSDTLIQDYTISLTALAGAPAQSPGLILPGSGVYAVLPQPVFAWSPQQYATRYELQVSRNPGFGASDLVYSGQTVDTSVQFTAGALMPGRVYYWRTRAANDCGEGPWSGLRAFQVSNASCNQVYTSTNVPLLLPSSSATTVVSTLNVPFSALVEKVKLSLAINHTWVGDLSAMLVSPTNDTVRLFDRPGVPASDFGCSGDNIIATFDDAAANTAAMFESACALNPAISGTYRSLEPMSKLVGKPVQGTWKLVVIDAFEEDGGALASWSLDFCFPLSIDTAKLLVNDTLVVDQAASAPITADLLRMDLDGTADQGKFVLLSVPAHGVIRRNGAVLGVGGTWSQADINGGLIAYQHDGSQAFLDGFQFDVIDEASNSWLHDQRFSIRIIPSPLSAVMLISQGVLCNGDANGILQVNATGDIGPYTYSLNGLPVQSNPVFTGLPSGIYTVTVSSSTGKTIETNAVNLEDPSVLSLSADVVGNDIITTGIGGTAPYAYSLDGTNFQPHGIFAGLINGPYTVTIRDANGCTATLDVVVNFDPLMAFSSVVTDVTCHGDSTGVISIMVGGGTPPYQFTYDGLINLGSSTISGLPAGTYSVTVTDASGASVVADPVVVVEPVRIDLTVVVAGNQLTAGATGGVPPYTYSLDGVNYQDSGDFMVGSGTYRVYVRDANGCVVSRIIVVNAPPPTVGIQTVVNPACFGEKTGSVAFCIDGANLPFSVDFGVTGVSIQSTAGGCASNLIASGIGAGSYVVTVTDGLGTSTTVQVSLTQPTALSGDVMVSNSQVTVVAGGGIPPYSYSLDGTNYQFGNMFTLANGTYIVFIRDANGCTISRSVVVSAAPPSVAIQQITDPSCFGASNGSIVLCVNGVNPPFTVDFGVSGISQQVVSGACVRNILATGFAAGTYTATIMDGLGALTTVPFDVQEPAMLNVNASVSGNQVTVNASGGVSPYQYSLDGIVYQAANTFTLFNGTYTLYVRDANGCTDTDVIIVDAPPPSAFAQNVLGPSCFGGANGSAELCINGVNPPFTIVFNQPNVNLQVIQGACTANILASGLSGGTYQAVITDAQGLSSLVQIDVNDPDPLDLLVSSNGDTLLASGAGGTPGYRYRLEGPISVPFQASGVFPGLPSGIYTVIVEDVQGCTATQSGVVITSSQVDLLNDWGVMVFPNPGNGLFTLDLRSAPGGLVLDVFDTSGRLLYNRQFDYPEGASWSQAIDLSGQPSGLYWFRLSSERRSGVVKVVIR